MDLFSDLPEPSSSANGNQSSGDQSCEATQSTAIPIVKQGVQEHEVTSGGEKRKHEDDVHSEESPEKKSAAWLYRIVGYVAERKGEREEMQDAHLLQPDLLGLLSEPHPSIERVCYYAVFDGHSGARASINAAENLHITLAKKFPKGNVSQVEKGLKKCFTESFKKTDEDFLKKAGKSKPSWKDGSTAVCMLAVNNSVFIANLGDSKAVLCRYSQPLGKCVAIALTKDHCPSLYEERIRIQKAGGHVRDGRVMGVLEVSRSLGDGPYKNHGVSCVPDVKRCPLAADDRFILIACDGLWKRFTNESAIEFVNGILEDDSIQGTDTKCALDVRYETACNRLANEAVRRLSADNVTVLLLAIHTPS